MSVGHGKACRTTPTATTADGTPPLVRSSLLHLSVIAICDMARPTGVRRAISTYTIPIEGRDEWLAAAGRLA
jgi:hypothetical protein